MIATLTLPLVKKGKQQIYHERTTKPKFAEKKHLIAASNAENNCLCGEYRL